MTRSPDSTPATARLRTTVVLPTPPFGPSINSCFMSSLCIETVDTVNALLLGNYPRQESCWQPIALVGFCIFDWLLVSAKLPNIMRRSEISVRNWEGDVVGRYSS